MYKYVLYTQFIDILKDGGIDSTTSALVQMNDVIDGYFFHLTVYLPTLLQIKI